MARLEQREPSRTNVPPVVIVAPYAVHDASIADFAPGHSLAQNSGRGRCGFRRLDLLEVGDPRDAGLRNRRLSERLERGDRRSPRPRVARRTVRGRLARRGARRAVPRESCAACPGGRADRSRRRPLSHDLYFADVRVARTLRVLERRNEVSGLLADLHQRRQDLTIVGMPRQCVRQCISRLIDVAGRIDGDSVDICVMRVLGSKFGGLLQFGQGADSPDIRARLTRAIPDGPRGGFSPAGPTAARTRGVAMLGARLRAGVRAVRK